MHSISRSKRQDDEFLKVLTNFPGSQYATSASRTAGDEEELFIGSVDQPSTNENLIKAT